ncbi:MULTISPECIES: very short patch repair endonuclease [unclassified Corallococcus]|uniref:very short patch repair endonuclease n=1 Tax=unclassified Corallococcus TaxID=2685029 RepID=UPI001A8EAE9C|nr:MULTISPECIES: very short patch repair endonuclease [unclassified Corallococcus]MBN9680923.1 DNA mismatch endonuclease Vsr [Corallococcus sp. NCSPR001]WAS87479.1 very short patch repair endonuclease [Corallococcus sp. NCRR]
MDTLTPQERSERMSRVKGRNTKPELVVRRLVTALGHRYRLHYGKVPGKPDLAFPGRRKAIFVHGCFWHRHPDPTCPLARLPKSRLDFWLPKLESNRERDLAKRAQLEALGWSVLEIWECELTCSPEQLTERIMEFLGPSKFAARDVDSAAGTEPAANA